MTSTPIRKRCDLESPALDTSTPETWAATMLERLAWYADNGLPGVYTSIQDWLCDFWPDLPWTQDTQYAVLWAMLTSSRMDDVAAAWLRTFDYNIAAELRAGLGSGE